MDPNSKPFSEGGEPSDDDAAAPPLADYSMSSSPDTYWYDPMQWSFHQHPMSSNHGMSGDSCVFEPWSTLQQEWASFNVPPMLEAAEPPDVNIDVAASPPVVETVLPSGSQATATMQAAMGSDPVDMDDQISTNITAAVVAGEDREAHLSTPPLDQIEAAKPSMVDSAATMGVESDHESLTLILGAEDEAPSRNLSLIPYQPLILPRLILLGTKINPTELIKDNGGGGVDKEQGCGDVAVGSVVVAEVLQAPTAMAKQPQQVLEIAHTQPKPEEGSPCVPGGPAVSIDQSIMSSAGASRPCDVKPRPSWLPDGWLYTDVQRTSGATIGRVDRYYYSPDGVLKFRSKVEVLSYLEHGKVIKREKKLKTMDADPSTNPLQAQMLDIPTPPEGMLLVPRGEPFDHLSVPRRGVLKVWDKNKMYHPAGSRMTRITHNSRRRVSHPPADEISTH